MILRIFGVCRGVCPLPYWGIFSDTEYCGSENSLISYGIFFVNTRAACLRFVRYISALCFVPDCLRLSYPLCLYKREWSLHSCRGAEPPAIRANQRRFLFPFNYCRFYFSDFWRCKTDYAFVGTYQHTNVGMVAWWCAVMLIYHHACQCFSKVQPVNSDTNTAVFFFRWCFILSNSTLRTFAVPNDSQISHSVMAVAPISAGREILTCTSIVMIFLSSFIGMLF